MPLLLLSAAAASRPSAQAALRARHPACPPLSPHTCPPPFPSHAAHGLRRPPRHQSKRRQRGCRLWRQRRPVRIVLAGEGQPAAAWQCRTPAGTGDRPRCWARDGPLHPPPTHPTPSACFFCAGEEQLGHVLGRQGEAPGLGRRASCSPGRLGGAGQEPRDCWQERQRVAATPLIVPVGASRARSCTLRC